MAGPREPSPSDRPGRGAPRGRRATGILVAAIALGAAGGPSVVPELEAMLMDTYPQVQLAAAKAMLAATSPH